jgi:hypothetical protein
MFHYSLDINIIIYKMAAFLGPNLRNYDFLQPAIIFTFHHPPKHLPSSIPICSLTMAHNLRRRNQMCLLPLFLLQRYFLLPGKILEEYVNEFQEGDADLRNMIIANAMAELSALQPELDPFDKIDASKVSFMYKFWDCRKLILH